MQLKAQSAWHTALIRLINRGGLSKADLINSLFKQKAVFRKQAKHLYISKDLQATIVVQQTKDIEVPFYQGDNEWVKKLIAWLNQIDVEPYLEGAYLHGSLANDEEINYSDFDALVILNEKAFESPETLAKVCQNLNQLSKLFYQYDPLQHHGWFVMTKEMLNDYPITYFPPELFSVSKSLLPDKGMQLKLAYNDPSKAEYAQAFWVMKKSLKRHLSQELSAFNVYQLKSVISQFMLLPALFLQAKNQTAIDKKQSFLEAPKYFSEAEWEVMDKVSGLRSQWDYSLNFWQKFWLCHGNYSFRKWGRRYAPMPKGQIKKIVEEISYLEMLKLIERMEEKLKIEEK
ncbi:MAG: nucleotidyltransferase domain-containing protein [Vicingaceae bacterium]